MYIKRRAGRVFHLSVVVGGAAAGGAMVKNFGGNKSKRQGRKHVLEAAASALARTRLKDEGVAGEVYAAATRMLGGSLCEVVDNEGRAYHCVIRSKFRGRHKRENMVSAGNWLLVGLRAWQTAHAPESGHGKPKCDLLEVYNSSRDVAYILEHHAELVGRLPLVEDAGVTAESADVLFEQELVDEARRARSAASGSYTDRSWLPGGGGSSDDDDDDDGGSGGGGDGAFDFDGI